MSELTRSAPGFGLRRQVRARRVLLSQSHRLAKKPELPPAITQRHLYARHGKCAPLWLKMLDPTFRDSP
jgi:hypothetical protein